MPGIKESRIIISLFATVVLISSVGAFSTKAPASPTKSTSSSFEYLKFDKNPSFDVLEKTKQYVDTFTGEGPGEEWYDTDNYVLRGPVIGPITQKDVRTSQKGLGIQAAFPDLNIDSFGFTIDPENPYRCFYFQRWRGTHTVDMDAYGTIYPASGDAMETPVSCFTVAWNQEGKIVYEQVGAVVDRHEGNTQGKAAVFGLLHTAGLKIPGGPGDKLFALIQRVGHLVGGMGRSWSKEEEIPNWWTSKSRGADDTDQE
mmetsp:Transcript_4454/g.5162  ORF Transcript_4454/g.5162 Transcript_4454/m.5162 type:complete len:257 (-) Transcript_4454:276-1046(-)|eukprot:CAMPEP_0194133690 /NCGR_PEP_ID=MMETSP0152-20130528/3754_1 /TAXON_ID=1049557 /ORGANISM="Thalassiothrix antarctica, Strain L6-D1" /LENGTH=256 /DNA_ID=CAMNT_0038829035 /DNA_START=24 /DNA_END=794 /DNA_ORIENTATION=+